MRTKTEIDLDQVALAPAPRPFQPSGNLLVWEKKLLFDTISKYAVVREGDSFSILKLSEQETFFEISTYPVLSLESFEGIDECEENRRFILSKDLEHWTAQQLARKDFSPPVEGCSKSKLRSYLEFSQLFSEETKVALFSGYLPRHHLGLSILLERLPALHTWVALFPLLLTHIAEQFLYYSVKQETFFPNLELACDSGWRGLFDFCDLPKNLNAILYVKNIILSAWHATVSDHDESHTTENCLHPLREGNLDTFPLRMPIHDAIFTHFETILPFSNNHPRWVNWQIIQRQRIRAGRDEPLLLDILSGDLDFFFESDGTREDYLRDLYLPLLSVFEAMGTTAPKNPTPKEFSNLPNPDSVEKERVFRDFLTEEERIEFRYLLREDSAEEIVKLLEKRITYSSGALQLFQLWNDEKIDLLLMKQPLLPPQLIRFFLYLYPENTSACPAFLFHSLSGQPIHVDFMTSKFLDTISIKPEPDDSFQRQIDGWNYKIIRQVIQDLGHTKFGISMAKCRDFLFPTSMAAFLRRNPPIETWKALLQHQMWEVRAFLTMNPYAPNWVKEQLAQDSSVYVRILLAEQPWFMIHKVVDMLLRDPSEEVIHALAWNRSLPDNIKQKIPINSPYTAALMSIKFNGK